MLTIHNIKRRSNVAINPVDIPSEPILTLHDLHRRSGIVAEAVKKAEEIQAQKGNVVLDPVSPLCLGVRDFADVVNEGIWKGRRCFIVGGGASLKGFDFGKLKGELTVGINRSFEKFTSSVLVGIDGRFITWAEDGTFGVEATRIWREYEGFRVWVLPHRRIPDDIFVIPAANTLNHRLGSLRSMEHGGNSGYAAIHMAALLGANPIYLLGFDMKGNGSGKQSWWHNGYPSVQNESVYKNMIDQFKFLNESLVQSGVRVVNLNRESRLKCFEFGDMGKVLSEKEARPVFVSAYTVGDKYELDIRNLKRSLNLFGLEYDVTRIEGDNHTWQSVTRLKPEIMLNGMEQHKGRAIVWCDADVEFVRDPKELYNLQDAVSFPANTRKLLPLSSIVGVDGGQASRDFLLAWRMRNTTYAALWEQDNFRNALEDTKLNKRVLSIGYTPYCTEEHVAVYHNELLNEVDYCKRADRRGARKAQIWLSPDGKPTVWSNMWKGRRCFIIGGGSSLKGFNWTKLMGECTIGVNRAYEVFDPAILFSIDTQYYDWVTGGDLGEKARNRFYECDALKVWCTAKPHPFDEGVMSISSISGSTWSEDLTKGLGTGSNSGYTALNMAYLLGANPIYLLGFDMQGAWWHNGYGKGVVIKDAKWDEYIRNFENVAGMLKDKGVCVYNCSDISSLTCFEHKGEMDIDFPQRFVVSSYYTDKYELESRRLRQSLARFGLVRNVEKIESRGNWALNTQYKPIFLLEMLDSFPNRDVVWIDADGEVMRYPELFDTLTCDIAAHKRNGKELLSGTLFLKNNEKVKGLLREWIQENNAHPNLWEQVNLDNLLKRTPSVNFEILPAEYTCIFDGMKEVTNPVVLHYQASRRLRNQC